MNETTRNDELNRRLPAPASATEDGAPLDIGELLATLLRRAWLVVGVMLVAGVAALGWVRLQPIVYRARAVIQLVDRPRALTGGLSEKSDRSSTATSILSEVEVIKSRAIATEVADSELVHWSGAKRSSREQLAGLLLRGLTVEPRKQTNLIDLTFIAGDPDLAKRMVNRLARVYQTANSRTLQEESRRRSAFIEQQLAKYDRQLTEAEHALSIFRTQQQAYTSAEKFSAQQTGLAEYRLRERDLEAERQIANQLLGGLESGDRTRRSDALRMISSSPGLSTNPMVSRLNTKLGEYETSLAEQTTGAWASATTHPEVRRLDSLIAGTERQLTEAVRGHVSMLDARIQSLNNLINTSESALRRVPGAEAAETRLVQNAAALRDQTALLRTELQKARISEAAAVGQVEIIDLATTASARGRGTPRVVAFALFLGLLVGGGLAILIEKLDKTIKRRDDVESVLRLPVLATIPRIGAGSRGAQPPDAGRLNGGRSTLVSRVQKQHAIDVSVMEEAFRQLRTGLLYSLVSNGQLRRILITSPVQGDGKTSVAANLGLVLAQQAYRVAVVDCDLHAPHLHRAFQLPVSPGLGEILSQGIPAGDYLRPTAVPGLAVLTAGAMSGAPGDVVGSKRMEDVLEELSRQFDMVILDTAPVLAVSDAVVLSTSADSVLLVVRAGRTTPEDAGEALRYLTSVGARIAGVVLNDPDERTRKYGGYYRGAAQYAHARA